MLFLYLVYFHGSNIVCSDDIRTCTFSHYTHWEFSDSPGFAHSGLLLLYSVDQVFGKDHMHYEEPVVFFT